ncbi:hypothetical protein ACFSO7_08675 [Bacillus sp. CGMCC 1.16607]|uniref:hypothetical protein n=1 Tax=Bacillus sp. CGMCC 1.16607 TaxID=3351842 RepID=UPI003644029A
MDIQKELKETTKILDELVPFTNEAKEHIFLKIETKKINRRFKMPVVRYKLGVTFAIALICLSIGVTVSPIAAQYAEPIIKLFHKGKEVAEVKTHHPITDQIASDLDIEKELEEIRNNTKNGEVRAVYIRESNPGVMRTEGKPYNLTTVIQKPVSITSLELIENEIKIKTIEEYTYLPLRKDQSDWRKGEDIKLPRETINEYQFSEGSISYRIGEYDSESLVEEAKRTGNPIVIKDLPVTDEVSGLWFKYKNNNSNFTLWLTFGQQADGMEFPDLDKVVEVTKINVRDSEAVYINHGDSKSITWIEERDGKKTKYFLSSETLTKEEMLKIPENLF